MSTDISAFGIRVQIFASVTFPAGITITQFADDGDSLDVPQQQIADKAMGVNGDLITWSKANPLNLTLNIIPASDDDRNMSVLLEANRVARGIADQLSQGQRVAQAQVEALRAQRMDGLRGVAQQQRAFADQLPG